MAEQPRKGRWTRLLRDLTPPGAVRALQRAGNALATEQSPERRLPAPPEPGDEARERARRALLEARQAMGGLLGDATSTPAPPLPSELDISRRLDDAAAERRRIAETVEGLRAKAGDIDDAVLAVLSAVEGLERRLDKLEGAIAAFTARPVEAPASPPAPPSPPPAAAPPVDRAAANPAEAPEALSPAMIDSAPPNAPETERAARSASLAAGDAHPNTQSAPPTAAATPQPVTSAESVAPNVLEHERTVAPPAVAPTDDERRALYGRIFPAGTIATRVRFQPVPPDFAALIARIATDPNVEHIEVTDTDPDAPVLAISFRLAQRWPQMSALLERALGVPLAEDQAGWRDGMITVRPPTTG